MELPGHFRNLNNWGYKMQEDGYYKNYYQIIFDKFTTEINDSNEIIVKETY